MRFPGLAPWCALVALACVAGCASPSDRVDQERKAVTSWRATARFAAGAWIRNATPDAFTRDVLSRARDGLRTSATRLRATEAAEPRDVEAVERAQQTVLALAVAVERGDRAAAARALRDTTGQAAEAAR
jgi:hypothetical protein